MISQFKPGDLERSFWSYVENNEPRVLESIADFEVHFPKKEIRFVGDITSSIGKVTRIYGFSNEYFTHKVGYQCGFCEELVLGAPIIIDVDSQKALAGRKGYDLQCSFCKNTLYSHTFSLS
ncbi:hypothetical protein J4223_03225 [Candidatus Woesearchaeota archaeon]|nr:hypothetical protein [Candidatus Woesearchaeota archaeon]